MKVAIITGSTGFLGREIIKRLLDLDYTVYGLCRNLDLHKSLYPDSRVIGIKCDLSDVGSINTAINKLNSEVELVDILLTTASPPVVFNKFSKIPTAKIIEDINVIYLGNALLILGLLDRLKKGSKVVNVLTSAVNDTPQGMGSYVAAKYALLGFSKALEKEVKSCGIEVICTYPPMMNTPFIRALPKLLKEKTIDPSIIADHMVPLFDGSESKFDLLRTSNPVFKDVSIDLESVDRFKFSKDAMFVQRFFSQNEIQYAFSKSRPEIHLAAFFCIKEAYFKLTNDHTPFSAIDVCHDQNGRPYLKINGYSLFDTFNISISHVKDYSVGVVLRGSNAVV